MQFRTKRPIILFFVSLLAMLALGIANGFPSESQSLAQPARVDPVQALLTQQAAEQSARLDTLLTVPQEEQGAAQAALAPRFVRITDAVESMTMDVPTEWKDTDSGPWFYKGENVGFYLTASPDLNKFNSDLSAPGIFFGVSTTLLTRYTEQELLTSEGTTLNGRDKACTKQPKLRYTDAFYQGDYFSFDNCRKQKGHFYLTHVATPANRAYVILLRVNLPKGTPPQVIRRIYSTFQVIGKPGLDEHHEPDGHTH